MATGELKVRTRRGKQVIDVTQEVEDYISSTGVGSGLCNIFVAHTTAGITTGEAIEGTDEDLMETLTTMIPRMDFRHGHDPSHAPDHMISSIVGPGVTIPVVGGKLRVGIWQRVLLVECNGPRTRDLIVTVISGVD